MNNKERKSQKKCLENLIRRDTDDENARFKNDKWAQPLVACGTIGKGVAWGVTVYGTLILNGRGTVGNPEIRRNPDLILAPWAKYNKYIDRILISSGITRVMPGVFNGAYATEIVNYGYPEFDVTKHYLPYTDGDGEVRVAEMCEGYGCIHTYYQAPAHSLSEVRG